MDYRLLILTIHHSTPHQMPDLRPEFIEQLRAETRGLRYRPNDQVYRPDPETARKMFVIATGNRWMELGSREPEAKMLLGCLWYQHELCILFADTNSGKSVLAVQIADSLSRGTATGPFINQAKPVKVLYIDFELSTTQFHIRYTSTGGHDHDFSDNFMRAEFYPHKHITGNLAVHQESIITGIETLIREQNPGVLIIDNITCLRGGTESAAIALPLMQSLRALRIRYHLSVLVLAHIPKRRHPGRPISADDMQGSKLLINFADSAFTIGKSSTQPGLRYLKQIKQRNSRQLYGTGNVCLCSIQKPGSFLGFRFDGYSPESQHLRTHIPAISTPQQQQLA